MAKPAERIGGEAAVNTSKATSALVRLQALAKQTRAALAGMPSTAGLPVMPSSTGLVPSGASNDPPKGVGRSNVVPTAPNVAGGISNQVVPPLRLEPTPPIINGSPLPDGRKNIRFPNKANIVGGNAPAGGYRDDIMKRFFALEQGGGKFAGFNIGPSGITFDKGAFIGLAGRAAGALFVVAGVGEIVKQISNSGREAVASALESNEAFHVALGKAFEAKAQEVVSTVGDKAANIVKWVPSVGHGLASLFVQGIGAIESNFGNAFGWSEEEQRQHNREIQNKLYAIEDAWQEFVGGSTRAERLERRLDAWSRNRDQILYEATKKAREMATTVAEKLQGFGFRGTLAEIQSDISPEIQELARARALEEFLKTQKIPTYDTAEVGVDDGTD